MPPTSTSPSTAETGEEAGGLSLPRVAREAIVEALGGRPSKEAPPEIDEYLAQQRGVIVTLYDKKGEVRGQGGGLKAETKNLLEETRQSAVAAATSDPERDPVKDRRALNKLRIEVTVTDSPERVDSIIELDPEIYGVILTAVKRGIRGIMMPNIPGLETVDKQLAAIRRNAGLRPDEHLRIERFRAEIFADPEE